MSSQADWRSRGQYRQSQWPQRAQWPSRRDDRPTRGRGQEETSKELKELILQVARLTVRLEDQLAISNLDCEFIMFFQTRASNNPWSITDSLYKVGVDWKKQKETAPQSLTQPLRNVMLYCVFHSMLQMMQRLEDPQQADVIQRAKELQLTEGTTYLYMRWDAEAKCHKKDLQDPLKARGGSYAAEEYAGLHGGSRRRGQVPRTSTPDSGSQIGGHPLPLDGAKSFGGQPGDVSCPEAIQPQRGNAPCGHDGQASKAGPLAPCPTSGPPDAEHVSLSMNNVLSLVLINKGSHCYANSSLVSLLWSMTEDCSASADEPATADAPRTAAVPVAERSLARLLRWLGRGGVRAELWQVGPWLRAVQS